MTSPIPAGAYVAAGVTFAGAILVAVFLPSRPGTGNDDGERDELFDDVDRILIDSRDVEDDRV